MQSQLLDEKNHNIKDFDCGNDSLNVFLKRYAVQQQKKFVGRTFVITNTLKVVIGFYTLSSGSIRHSDAPEILKMGLPKYPIPTIILGRLAVDLNFQKKKLGNLLLKDALKRIVAASLNIGIVAVVVHAKDENAASFYKKYGFIPFDNEPNTLFLQIKSIIKAQALALENSEIMA